MSNGRLILLVFGTLLFAWWAFQMFRAMFLIRRRGAEATGSSNPGPVTTLCQWRAYLRNSEDALQRNRLALTTLALIIWVAVTALAPF